MLNWSEEKIKTFTLVLNIFFFIYFFLCSVQRLQNMSFRFYNVKSLL